MNEKLANAMVSRKVRDCAEIITRHELDKTEKIARGFDPNKREYRVELRHRVFSRLREQDECRGVFSFLLLAFLSGVISHYVRRWLEEREKRKKEGQ